MGGAGSGGGGGGVRVCVRVRCVCVGGRLIRCAPMHSPALPYAPMFYHHARLCTPVHSYAHLPRESEDCVENSLRCVAELIQEKVVRGAEQLRCRRGDVHWFLPRAVERPMVSRLEECGIE